MTEAEFMVAWMLNYCHVADHIDTLDCHRLWYKHGRDSWDLIKDTPDIDKVEIRIPNLETRLLKYEDKS